MKHASAWQMNQFHVQFIAAYKNRARLEKP